MADKTNDSVADRIVVSPCSNPEMSLEEALRAYSEIGYTQFEVVTSWTHSAVDYHQPPERFLELAATYHMRYASFHLPLITSAHDDALNEAVLATQFAKAIGCEVVIFKADSIENYIAGGKPFLDRIAGLDITPVLQNSANSALATLDEYVEVMDGINDRRMKSLLEVGHFHSIGIGWQQAYAVLEDTVALVHIQDQIKTQSVPFGSGDVDLPGLFQHLRTAGYSGKYVVELEVDDAENSLKYLADALVYLRTKCLAKV